MTFTAQHPVFFIKEKLNLLCKPLRHTPFTSFSNVRFHFDGFYSTASQLPEFDRQLFINNCLPGLDELHSIQSRYIYLSCTIPLPEFLQRGKFQQHIELAKDFDLYHQFILINRCDQFVDISVFGLNKLKLNVIDISLNYLSRLQKFCIYFRESGQNLITEMEEEKIIFENPADPIFFEDISLCDSYEYKQFISELQLKKYLIRGKNGNCFLTPREFECLLWLYKNRSIKQIAMILSRSPRTIEVHISNLKTKLGCHSIQELFDIYSKNPIIDIFSN